jgi:Tfp pilus assembly protein PilO
MNFKGEKNKQIIQILGYILALFLIFLIFILPVFDKIKTITEEIDQEREILEKRMNLDVNSKNIKENLEMIENDLPKLNSIYIKEGKELEMINFIESIAFKNNLKLDLRPNFNTTKVEQEPVKLPVNITVEGSFLEIYSFIKDLDASPFYFISEQLSYTNLQNELVSLTLNGYVYFIK